MLIKQERENFWILNWLDEFMEGHKGFIVGGCFKNIFNHERVKDLDTFFRSREDWQDAVNYFDSKTKGYIDLEEYDECDTGLSEEDAEYTFYYQNENVKAYKHIRKGTVIELCNRIFGTPEEILNQFDFTITKFAYYKEEVEDESGAEIDKEFEEIFGDAFAAKDVSMNTHIEYRILHDDKFFEHLHMKRLVTDNQILFPVSTFERMLRYAKYGYFPCKETKMKIIKALSELSDKEIVLSESLYKGMD